MTPLIDRAVYLLHKKERLQIDRFYIAWISLRENGEFEDFENTNFDKLWTWACKRWKHFPTRECEIRTKNGII
jgi:hypothetical protein